MSQIDKEDIHYFQEIINNENKRKKDLLVQLEDCNKKLDFYDRLLKFIENEWFLHTVEHIKSNSLIINEITKEESGFPSFLDTQLQIATVKSNENLKKFPLQMEQKFKDLKPSIDMTSKHPKYSFENGFLQLQLNETNKRVKISDYEGKLFDIPADLNAIAQNLQDEYKRIFQRPFNRSDFLKKIRNNYLAVIKKMEKKDGDSIHIRSITQRLGKNEKGFRTDEFVIDLSNLVKQGSLEIDNLKLELQQTKDDNQGMLLYQIPGIGYIGQINFKKI